jgi:hypothetical protein
MQQLVDQAGNFNLFSLPNAGAAGAAIHAAGDRRSVIGWRIDETLHRFTISCRPPSARAPVTGTSVVGETVGRFTGRWLLMPRDFVALPDREPPPTPLDPQSSQRFVMLDGVCRFGGGRHGFRGFGTGQTLPTTVRGQRQLLVTAIGTIVEGFGALAGHEEGTYVYCGTLAPHRGFTGNVFLRVVDRQGTLRTGGSLPPPRAQLPPEAGISYLLLRGQAVPEDSVTPRLGADGRPFGLIVKQGIRLLDLDSTGGGSEGSPQSTDRFGPRIGTITATIAFDPASASGTALDPVPFTNSIEFAFFDGQGGAIGSFIADSSEGRVFNAQLAGQPAIRFGGTGRALSGTGPFQGITGLATDNSLVAFAPHVSASVYVLRLNDPQGQFRAAVRRA